MNKTASKEWLRIAQHDLLSAQILFDANHFTDSIGNDLQQALEKILKSFLAYQNAKIPKSHDLLELYEYISEDIELKEKDLRYLALATEYFKEERYPNPNYFLPPKEEIEEVLAFTKRLFTTICDQLEIDPTKLN